MAGRGFIHDKLEIKFLILYLQRYLFILKFTNNLWHKKTDKHT